MIRKMYLPWCVFALNWLLLPNSAGEEPSARPNVLLVMIDDLRPALGCYGDAAAISPNIDRLADEGMRFTNGYSACNVCSPSRAAILTGKNPARLLLTQWLPSGRWSATGNRMREGRYVSNLPLEETTIAEALRDVGYRTGFVGKWHLDNPNDVSTAGRIAGRYSVSNWVTSHSISNAMIRKY